MKCQNQFKNRLETTRAYFTLAIQTRGCGSAPISIYHLAGEKKKSWCVVYAGFSGVNTLAMAAFELPVPSLILELEELSTIGSHEWV